MIEQRFEFVVSESDYPTPGARYLATLGDYDLDCPTGSGDTPQLAIIDWLEMNGDNLGEST